MTKLFLSLVKALTVKGAVLATVGGVGVVAVGTPLVVHTIASHDTPPAVTTTVTTPSPAKANTDALAAKAAQAKAQADAAAAQAAADAQAAAASASAAAATPVPAPAPADTGSTVGSVTGQTHRTNKTTPGTGSTAKVPAPAPAPAPVPAPTPPVAGLPQGPGQHYNCGDLVEIAPGIWKPAGVCGNL